MKLLLAFNLAAFAFVVVTNSGYVPEIVEGQDPYCELGIIAGNLLFGWLTVAGWRKQVHLHRTAKELFKMRLDRMQALLPEPPKITSVETPKEFFEAGERLMRQQAAQQLWDEAKSEE